MDLGQRIRTSREALSITQQELADALKVSAQHVSAVENGKKIPSLALVSEVARQLGVSIDYLVSGEEGVIKDTVPAIKADKGLSLKAKKALISLVEELRD
ncbi:helix-turn-helix domain-containing protein [Chloroflexota bacterium]